MPVPSTMPAAVYRGPGKVCVETLPVPEIGPGEALVRIHACGVCGTDLKKIQYGLVEPPRVFGHEMAGVIEAVGAGVTGWKPGDRVAVMHHVPCLDCYYCSHGDFAQCPTYKKTGTTAGFEPAGGGYAQYIRVMDWIVRLGMVRVPDDVTFEEATFIEPVNTVLKAVENAGVGGGETVLVVGQGQIGLLFTQVLARRGAVVIATDPMPFRREQSVRFGAAAALNPDVDDVVKELRSRTEGRGADVAIVTVPLAGPVGEAVTAVRPGGKVVMFAHTRLNDPVEVDGGAVCMLEKDLIGSYSSDISLQEASAELIFRREIDVASLITHRFPLAEIDSAIQMAARPSADSLKVMVTI